MADIVSASDIAQIKHIIENALANATLQGDRAGRAAETERARQMAHALVKEEQNLTVAQAFDELFKRLADNPVHPPQDGDLLPAAGTPAYFAPGDPRAGVHPLGRAGTYPVFADNSPEAIAERSRLELERRAREDAGADAKEDHAADLRRARVAPPEPAIAPKPEPDKHPKKK